MLIDHGCFIKAAAIVVIYCIGSVAKDSDAAINRLKLCDILRKVAENAIGIGALEG